LPRHSPNRQACQAMPETGPEMPSLADRLRQRITSSGPVTFADFMEMALYDSAEGFYSKLRVGEGGDFVTSPHVSPVFGRLVARQVEEFWHLLDRPDPFYVIEVGAGEGTLAGQVIRALAEPVPSALRYVAVDRSAAAREVLSRLDGVRVAESLEEIGGGLAGCILANELLDNLPFHRVLGRQDGPVELFVGLDGDELVLVEGPPSSDRILEMARHVPAGEETVVRPGADTFLDQAAQTLSRGYVWVVDYGFTSVEETGSTHGYLEQRLVEDVLSDPGSRDITAGVDFAALADHARSMGLAVWGPVTQRDALLSLGFRALDEEAQSRQLQAISERRGIEALRIYSDRTRANLVLSRSGLGAFYVLCLGVKTDRSPGFARG
jgi:SAM-dependent MidA family methyltransferase